MFVPAAPPSCLAPAIVAGFVVQLVPSYSSVTFFLVVLGFEPPTIIPAVCDAPNANKYPLAVLKLPPAVQLVPS